MNYLDNLSKFGQKWLSGVGNRNHELLEPLCIESNDLRLDYTNSLVDKNVLKELLKLLEYSGFSDKRADFFSGKKINKSENRAALHTALRQNYYDQNSENSNHLNSEIIIERKRCFKFADKCRKGEIRSVNGKKFTDVVNIGIGGSDLGPLMVCDALKAYQDGLKPHFVSNIDETQINRVIKKIDLSTTLFVVASKTFRTVETIENAKLARSHVKNILGDEGVFSNFIAISSNLSEVKKFGIKDENIFKMWDWVGGRFSVWSSIGMTVMLSCGPKQFQLFLDGAELVDRHFRDEPPLSNIPIILALLGVWHRNGLGTTSQAILPYSQSLARFPAFLQQLEMESNGKSIDQEGQKITWKTAPVIWGEPGTNGQHSFHQLLHQGTDLIPCDILLAANPQNGRRKSHNILIANCLAQVEALRKGQSIQELAKIFIEEGTTEQIAYEKAKHRVVPGIKPVTLIMFSKLTPKVLGQLIAIYEHKVFVQSVIWNTNPFDQWGVELGKSLYNEILPLIETESDHKIISAATLARIKWIRRNQISSHESN